MTQDAPTDIRSRGLFLADHAVVVDGKVYANGAFVNRLAFPSFPVFISFSVVGVLEVPWRAHDQQHRFAVRLEDTDARSLPGRFEGEFVVGAAPDMKMRDPSIVPFAGTINNLVFERPGDFAVVLEVDGAEIDRWPFRVVQHFTTSRASRASSESVSQS